MTNIVTFQGVALDIIDLSGQRWLRGPQIAGALGFASAKHISTLFKRHKPEFGYDMTSVVELPTAGGRQMVRIFSPRGAALIAMLAKTERAAAFRKWVLDTLEAQELPMALPAPAALEPLLTAEARALLRYRRLGLTTAECARLLGRGATSVKQASARLRAAGLLPAVRPAQGAAHGGSLRHVG